MAVYPLVIAPDPRLNQASKKVEAVDDSIRTLCKDMLETMYANHGIGLAAVQVGVHKRIIVIDLSNAATRYGDSDNANFKPMVLINPEIIAESGDLSRYNEGCLSFPDQYSDVERPAQVTVRFLDEHGTQHTIEAKGLLATCIQHEIDHINGVVFVDHISKLKRDMILKRLTKAKKLGMIDVNVADEVPANR